MQRQAANAAPAMLTVREVAERLAISPHTVYRLARAGNFPGATRVGNSWRVDPRRLDAAMFALRNPTTKELGR